MPMHWKNNKQRVTPGGKKAAAQAAAFLRVGRSTIYQLIAAGELESIPVHGHHRIPVKSVRKFLRKTSAKAL